MRLLKCRNMPYNGLILVQAGGGKASVKFGNLMYIKALVCLLSELNRDTGHTILKTDAVLSILDDETIFGLPDKKKKMPRRQKSYKLKQPT